jgi:hypothetical protein
MKKEHSVVTFFRVVWCVLFAVYFGPLFVILNIYLYRLARLVIWSKFPNLDNEDSDIASLISVCIMYLILAILLYISDDEETAENIF